ncbi:hypothetical protein TNCV_1852941 [Trichonephila clavipes]|nr:hypothetical protein TNCV_1852941 [Trichonephila clavipes]
MWRLHDRYKWNESGPPTVESIPNKWYCQLEGQPRSSQSSNICTGLLMAFRARWQMWKCTHQLARDLSVVSGRKFSRQTLYSRLAEIVFYVRHPVLCLPLTASYSSVFQTLNICDQSFSCNFHCASIHLKTMYCIQ